TDGDGLDNKFDSDNSSSRGTSQYMGNGGSFTGPSSAGSRAMVQKTYAMFTDRDWRQVEYILDLEFLSFTGILAGEQVELNWEVLSYAGVRAYVVEESVDGVVFVVSGRVAGASRTGAMMRYSYRKEWKGGTKSYYRIKAIQEDNKTIASNIQMIQKGTKTEKALQVLVNPVQSKLQVALRSSTSQTIQLQVFDAKGRLVKAHRQQVTKGANTFSIPETVPMVNGYYYLRTELGGELLGASFIIQR
ncbi:MAG TPA: T9SS type A sorting domain-containing protein, partial [Flavisolibacter sp.]